MWWTVVSTGANAPYPTDWPRGPWKSKDEAAQALDRWAMRRNLGNMWATIQTAHNIRVIGPFRTRAIARYADISNWSALIER